MLFWALDPLVELQFVILAPVRQVLKQLVERIVLGAQLSVELPLVLSPQRFKFPRLEQICSRVLLH